VLGADGLPPTKIAGNVLRSETRLKIAMRIPPTLDSVKAGNKLKEILEKDPPYNC